MANNHKHIASKTLLLLLTLIACQSFVACQTKEQKVDAAFNKCQQLRDKEKTLEAIICLENFVKSNPERGFTYYLLSEDYREVDRIDDAEKTIKYFIMLYPTDSGGHESYCRLLEQKGDFNKAYAECSSAISLDNKNTANWLSAASVKEKLGDFEMAEIFYKNALALDPKNQVALFFLGVLYEKTGKLDEALETLQKALELNPEYSKKLEERIKSIKKRREDEQQKNSAPRTKSKAAI